MFNVINRSKILKWTRMPEKEKLWSKRVTYYELSGFSVLNGLGAAPNFASPFQAISNVKELKNFLQGCLL